MSIQHAIWNVGDNPTPLEITSLAKEQLLEEMIVRKPEILSPEWMLIGRQESTGFGGRIDLLAIAPDASLVLIELKRNRTPREIVAQALDYAAWVEKLTSDQIAQIYQNYSKGGNLNTAFEEHFGAKLDEGALNATHQIMLVAAELDDASERIIQYLNNKGIPINVMLFQVFKNGPGQLLSRAWMIDPGKTQTNAAVTATKDGADNEPWNGEYYVSFGDGPTRSWEKARKYGFVSAGGGEWYSRTLKLLNPNKRVWVKIPGSGFVGVGMVTGDAVKEQDFEFKDAAGNRVDSNQALEGTTPHRGATDAEWFVPVRWIETVSAEKAFDEVGLFGNQNSVCKPTAPKWQHTVERLKTRFPKWNQ